MSVEITLLKLLPHPPGASELTHWGLVTPYGSRDLGQHWLRQWLGAWRHQAITWTNVDLSSLRSSDIHLRAVSHLIPLPPFTKIRLKIAYIRFHSNLPEVNKLTVDAIVSAVFSCICLAIHVILFLKLISYVQVNSWCRLAVQKEASQRMRRTRNKSVGANLLGMGEWHFTWSLSESLLYYARLSWAMWVSWMDCFQTPLKQWDLLSKKRSDPPQWTLSPAQWGRSSVRGGSSVMAECPES